MSYIVSLPFDRGQIFADVPGSTDWELDLGQSYRTRDNLNTTGRTIELLAVRNESGGTLTAGTPVKWVATRVGLAIGGQCDPGDPLFAGWVDDAYSVSNVSVVSNAIFYLLQHGPSNRFGDSGTGYAVMAKKMIDAGMVHGQELDQFNSFLEAAKWVTTKDGAGSQAIQSSVNGILLMTTDTTDNNEVIIASPGSQFLFAQGKTIYFGARIKVQEVATNTANVYVGLASGNMNALIGDNGGGPPASFSGALFYKVDGGTVWNTCTSIGSTQTLTALTTARDTSNYVTLNAAIYTTSSTAAVAKYYINGTLVRTDTFTYTGAAQMKFAVGVHTGTGSAETLFIDYAYCIQNI
jgi:hypothetical protein